MSVIRRGHRFSSNRRFLCFTSGCSPKPAHDHLEDPGEVAGPGRVHGSSEVLLDDTLVGRPRIPESPASPGGEHGVGDPAVLGTTFPDEKPFLFESCDPPGNPAV